MLKIFVVILNWNAVEMTTKCLSSVRKMKKKNCQVEVVLVDNASTDESRLVFKDMEKKKVFFSRLIVNDSNLGYAAGNNVAIKYAMDHGADYVLILNNDVELDENLLEQLLAGAKRHPDAGLVVPKIYFLKGSEFHRDRYKKSELGKVIWAAGGGFDWANVYGINIGLDEVDHGQFDKEVQVEKAPGTCVLISTKMLRKVGLFDEKFFMYHEDDDLSIRATRSGWSIWYIPSAVIWHASGASSGIGSELMDYFTSRNRMLLGMRYASLRTKIALVRESFRLLIKGRKWQRYGIRDFYLGRWKRGSWIDK